MSKVVTADFQPSTISKLKQALYDEHLSFLLITCSKPSEEGKINIEMDSNGDHDLLACALKSAENYLD